MADVDEVKLYGTPGAEHLYLTIEGCYEGEIDPWTDEDGDARTVKKWCIEEWSAHHPAYHLPAVDQIVEWVTEMAADNELDEGATDDYHDASQHPDVIGAFQNALDLYASKITYRMADKQLRTFAVTWTDDGAPLLDGAPLYEKAAG